jgi:hypothetical protein
MSTVFDPTNCDVADWLVPQRALRLKLLLYPVTGPNSNSPYICELAAQRRDDTCSPVRVPSDQVIVDPGGEDVPKSSSTSVRPLASSTTLTPPAYNFPVTASIFTWQVLESSEYNPVRSIQMPVPAADPVGGVAPMAMALAVPGSHRLPVTVRFSTVLSERMVFLMPPESNRVETIRCGCWLMLVSPGCVCPPLIG